MIDRIILYFLGIMTLRELISFSGLIPRNKKFSWLIYNTYEKYVIDDTMKAVGIEKTDIKNIVKEKKFSKNGQIVSLENLIEIISKYIIFHEGKVEYGNRILIDTTYYISTVEAVYESEYLRWMCCLINDLVSKSYRENGKRAPDFILTPKGGNTHFGRTYAESREIMFITSKYSVKSSYVTFLKGDFEYNLKTNYEGSWQLFERQKNSDEKLYGIIVDCNTTTGEQIVDTMNDFNYLVKELGLNVDIVTEAYTLYRPIDKEKCDIDTVLGKNGYHLHRFFDLSERNKELVIKYKGKKDRLNIHKKKDLKKIHKILNEITILEK